MQSLGNSCENHRRATWGCLLDHRLVRGDRSRIVAAAAVASLACMAPVCARADDDSGSGEKMEVNAPRTHTKEELKGIAEKDAWTRSLPEPKTTGRTLTNVVQVSQKTSYYCGPATLIMVLKARDRGDLSQDTAARWLGTDTDGTDWNNGSASNPQYPMADQLTAHSGAPYYAQNVNYTPTAAQKADYQRRLKADIQAGYALAAGAFEVLGGPRLVGHPRDREIYHWFAVRGYNDDGTGTRYADPASGATSLSWSDDVPQYSTLSSDTIATIMGGRGYIW